MSDAWIQTFTGKKFYPFAPNAADVCIEDIAHALAYTCRFGGHCKKYYSVAEHSIAVMSLMPPVRMLQLAALLHDAPEAYVGDTLHPIKSQIRVTGLSKRVGDVRPMKEIESMLHGVILSGLGLPHLSAYDEHDMIKQADTMLLLAEAKVLMGKLPEPWKMEKFVMAIPFVPMLLQPDAAEKMFLEHYYALTKEAAS
jgi:hypothetical protein